MFTFYRFEWSFGESLAIETQFAPKLWVTNGVLQPGTHNPATNIIGADWAKEEVKILPNPVKNMLEIDFFNKQKGTITMNLLDPMGRMVGTRQFDYYGIGRIEKWDMTKYASGVYFLEIVLTNTNYPSTLYKKGSFQVVKIN
jgi:hypothetical protein